MFVTVDLKDILKLVFRVVRIVLALVLLFGSIYWIMHGGKEQVISWYMGLWRWAVQMYDAHKVEILFVLARLDFWLSWTVTFFESERYRFVSLFLRDECIDFRVRFCGIIFGWCTRYLMLLPPRASFATSRARNTCTSHAQSTRTKHIHAHETSYAKSCASTRRAKHT